MISDLRHIRFSGTPAAVTHTRRTSRARPKLLLEADEPAYAFACSLLRASTLDPDAYQAGPLLRRVPAVLRTLRASSPAEAASTLARRPDLLDRAVDSLLIGVTEFFRDAQVFDEIRSQVIPALANRPGDLRVWSAGCSTGAELYSVAICLAEAGLLERASLLGTDCRPGAVAVARSATYSPNDARGLPAQLVARYLRAQPKTQRAQPSEALRRRMEWQTHDLTSSARSGPWHIVLCRNVAIYFTPSIASAMFGRLCSTLAPGGFLIVGRAERPPAQRGLIRISRCVYRLEGVDGA